MNERIKELARQADEYAEPWRCSLGGQNYQRVRDTKFAELVAEDAVAKEREACAKLCDDEARQSGSDHEAGGMYWCAEKIRARGEK